jgi:hypothetical protein
VVAGRFAHQLGEAMQGGIGDVVFHADMIAGLQAPLPRTGEGLG